MPIIRMPDFVPLTIVIFLLLFFCRSFFFFQSGQSCYEFAVYQLNKIDMTFFPPNERQTQIPHYSVVYSIYKFSWIIESANKHLLFDYYLLVSFVYYIILSNCIHWLVVIELNESKFEKAFLCGSNGSMLLN